MSDVLVTDDFRKVPDRVLSPLSLRTGGRRVTPCAVTLALVAEVLSTGWGVAHLFPTRSIVRGFGDIGTENERVITMEWIFEGVTLMFVGVLTLAVTLVGDDTSTTVTVVYVAVAMLLLAMAVISLLTAGRNTFIVYRLCVPIFGCCAVLLLAAAAAI